MSGRVECLHVECHALNFEFLSVCCEIRGVVRMFRKTALKIRILEDCYITLERRRDRNEHESSIEREVVRGSTNRETREGKWRTGGESKMRNRDIWGGESVGEIQKDGGTREKKRRERKERESRRNRTQRHGENDT